MDLNSIIGYILIALAIVALIVLLFIVMIPQSKEEVKYKRVKIAMYKAITEYVKNKKQ